MKFLEKYWITLSALFVFAVYFFTLAPSVVQIDSGELAAVQIMPGIAHPTGYPLFTILGYLFASIPLPITKIFQVNLLAAIYCSAAYAFFAATIYLMISNVKPDASRSIKKTSSKKTKTPRSDSPNENKIPVNVKIIISIFGGLTIAFSRTFWLQSTSTEVYSLHVFLISAIIYFLVKIYFEVKTGNTHLWYVAAVLFGLAFGNHMTTLMLIPAAVYIFFVKEKFGKQVYVFALKLLAAFTGSLVLVYSYLPLMASTKPALNWGNPVDVENIIRHVGGKQYRVWLFSSLDSAKKHFINYLDSLPEEFGYIVLILFLLGLIKLFKLNTHIFIFFTATFIITSLYASNYDIVDIDTYYLLANISIAVFAAFGFCFITEIVILNNFSKIIITAAAIVFSGYQFFTNLDHCNQNDVYVFEDYTKALINSADTNSIILSYQWDYFVSASYYFQNVESLRTDVKIIDKELLRRSWYYDQLNTNYSGLFNGFEGDVNEFLSALAPFEHDEVYDAQKLEHYYQRIMTNIVSYNFPNHSIYIAPELVENEMNKQQFKLPAGYGLVPDLFLFKVVNDSRYYPAIDPDFSLRFPAVKNHYHKFIEDILVKMLIYRTMYEIQFDKIERAKVYANKILDDFPGYSLPVDIKKKLSL